MERIKSRKNTVYVCNALYKKDIHKYCACLRTTDEYKNDLLKHGTPSWRLRQLEKKYNVSWSTMQKDRIRFEKEAENE